MSLLEDIVRRKNDELVSLGAPTGRRVTANVDVVAALRRGVSGATRDPLRLITEVKFKSPSAGPLSRSLGAGARAIAYARGGARFVSVLCDAAWFDGSYDHVRQARLALDAAGFGHVGVLAKEFVVDPRQIAMAAHVGASAVLVIVRIVDDAKLAQLVASARDLGLEPIVEITDTNELDRALRADARVIGVNARDLDTLVIDRARAERVVTAIPADRIALALSGLKTEDDVRTIAAGRADGALVGEILMREDDPEPLVARFAKAANS